MLGGVIGKRRAGVAIRQIPGSSSPSWSVSPSRPSAPLPICNHASGSPLGLPLAGVLVVFFLVVLTFLAKRTTFGRHVYAVGGNAEAARRAGINVPRIRILVFMISGAMAAVGGIILAANVNSVDLNFGGGHAAAQLDRRGGDRRREPLRRPRRGARPRSSARS